MSSSLKPCPPGKERNTATNRCRKIQTQKKQPTKPKKQSPQKTQKICPPGKELNPATNRCRKIKVNKMKKTIEKPTVVKDVLNNLITINGHGTFNSKKIKVPKGFQVMVPHRNGLDTDYTTPDAEKQKLYEEDLYKRGYLNYRDGWKLYLPGDDINDLIVSTFYDAASCPRIDESHALQKPLISACKMSTSYKKSCPLYCTEFVDGSFDYLDYKGSHKLKIKACSQYKLSQLFRSLPKQMRDIPTALRQEISPGPGEPIILIPFTCNAKDSSQINPFDHGNRRRLNTIYQGLIKGRA